MNTVNSFIGDIYKIFKEAKSNGKVFCASLLIHTSPRLVNLPMVRFLLWASKRFPAYPVKQYCRRASLQKSEIHNRILCFTLHFSTKPQSEHS